MGFDAAKQQVIQALQDRRFRHEVRRGERKNLLATGEVSIEEAISLLTKTRGHEASSSKYHFGDLSPGWLVYQVLLGGPMLVHLVSSA